MLSSGWSMATFPDRVPGANFLRWNVKTSRGLAIRPWNSWPKRIGLNVSVTPVASTYFFVCQRRGNRIEMHTLRRMRGSIRGSSGSPAAFAWAFRSSHCS